MPSFYSITPLSGQMLVTGNQGEITFSVANTTDRILQTRFDLGLDVPTPAEKEWLQVDTKPCNIPPKGTVQVIAKLKAPPGTEGAYHFCIVAATAPRTDEDFTVGPTISFTLAKGAGMVQSQTPTAGQPAPDDKVVTLEVSSALASVPCVEGLQVFDAMTKL